MMAEAADLQSAQKYYDFLVTSGQFNPDVFEEHRQLQERFGSASAAAEPMADTSAESTPELDNFLSLMDPDLPVPTEQEFQQAGTEVEESLTEVEGMRPVQEYAQGLMDENPVPGARQNDNRPLFQRLMTAATPARQNLRRRPSVKVEPEPETEVEEAALVEGTIGKDTGEQETEETVTTTTETVDNPDAYQVSLWQDQVGATISSPAKKSIYDDVKTFINDLKVPEITQEGGFYFFGDNKQDYLMLRDKIDTEIDKYETSIQSVAAEQQQPPLEGANKWLAILGVALGAAGSALTGTPNEAMQMLESFLDREQQKFLKSKEMRMKSADQQRLDLIRRRGELLQQFQNETQRVMAISQFQLQKTNALANIQSIQDQITEKQKQNEIDNQLAVAKILKDIVVSENTLKASMGASERERYVPSLELTDQDGNKVMYAGFNTRSKKSAEKMWEYYSIMANAEGIINDLEPLLERSIVEKLSPAAFSQTRTEILELTAELEKEFKNLAGFGANYAEREIMLNQATLPSIMNDSTINLLIGAKRAIGPFRRKINRSYTNKIKPHGGSSVNVPGQLSSTGKTYGTPRNN
jgi:hypothetical protein